MQHAGHCALRAMRCTLRTHADFAVIVGSACPSEDLPIRLYLFVLPACWQLAAGLLHPHAAKDELDGLPN